jgi:hypothetical protein
MCIKVNFHVLLIRIKKVWYSNLIHRPATQTETLTGVPQSIQVYSGIFHEIDQYLSLPFLLESPNAVILSHH